MIADAFDHSLDQPATLVKLLASVARIRLVASAPVLDAAEECCDRIVELYDKPNRRIQELHDVIRSGELAFFRRFADACRIELQRYSVR